MDFNDPLVGQSLTITFDATNSESQNIGVDNIRFGQISAAAVPEAGTMPLALLGTLPIVGLLARRQRKPGK